MHEINEENLNVRLKKLEDLMTGRNGVLVELEKLKQTVELQTKFGWVVIGCVLLLFIENVGKVILGR